jgi:hypothetical protein
MVRLSSADQSLHHELTNCWRGCHASAALLQILGRMPWSPQGLQRTLSSLFLDTTHTFAHLMDPEEGPLHSLLHSKAGRRGWAKFKGSFKGLRPGFKGVRRAFSAVHMKGIRSRPGGSPPGPRGGQRGRRQSSSDVSSVWDGLRVYLSFLPLRLQGL